MLAVVHQYEQPTVREVGHHGVERGDTGLLPELEHARDGGQDERALRQRRQLDEPHSIGMVADRRRRELDGQTRLPASARAHQGKEAGRLEQPPDLGHLTSAPDEGRQAGGEVVRSSLTRDESERRCLVGRILTGSHPASSRWGSGQVRGHGSMFWFTLKRLPGSYARLISTRRS